MKQCITMSVEMRKSGGNLVVFFILWSHYAPRRCVEDTENITSGYRTTSGQNDSVLVLRAAGSQKTYNVNLTNLKEFQIQNGPSTLKILVGYGDTVNGNPVVVPPGLYFPKYPENNTATFPIGYNPNAPRTELSEARKLFKNDQNEADNSTEQDISDSEVLNDWNIVDDYSVEPPRQYYETWSIYLNVTNCTAYGYGNEIKVTCHDVDLDETGPQLPENTTILQVNKCSGSNALRNPVLSHMTSLRFLQLYFCRIRFIKSIFFEGLENLRKLKLNSNDIMVFGKRVFANVLNITEINLSSNNIMSLRSLSDAVKDLSNLSTLYLNNNKILSKIRSAELENLKNTNIETLTLSDCALSYVEDGAFLNLKNLKTLYLSINPLGRAGLLNITKSLVFSKIQELELQEMTQLFRGDGFITRELQPLENTQIVSLNLDSNYIVKLNETEFPNLISLRKLSMNNCFLDLIHPDAFAKLIHLQQLFLRGNRLISISFQIPSLRAIDMSSNPDRSFKPAQFQIPDGSLKFSPNLYVFKLVRSTYIGPINRNTFSGLHNLKKLYIESTSLNNISNYAFEDLNDLRHLFLSSNSIKELTGKTFVGLHKLTRLNIDSNFLSYFSDGDVFNPLMSLELLTMRRNQLKHLPPNLFLFNEKLEILELSHNLIPAWNNEVFSPNKSLKVLMLRNNALEDVTPTMLTIFKNLEELDLSGNVLICNTCNMKRFQDWIFNPGNTTVRDFKVRPDTYICSDPDFNNVSLADAIIPFSLCLPTPDNTVAVVLISVCTCAALILGFTLSLYKLRWYVRYMMFTVRSRVKRYREFKNQKNYTFDAFVSYSSADLSWVAEELVPRLEGPECSLRLCLHDRNFMVGVPITDNILESIDSSRKTVMVLTEDYVKSNWCMFELHMAQHKLFEDTRDALVLIQLKDVSKQKLPGQLKYLMKTRTYIPWITADKSLVGNRLFWKKLTEALKPVEKQHTFSRII